ncbi:MAG: zinc ABC transporter substrate-binding protein, partial [Ruminococcus sp.]|nr:zinc ABC transporter substrate-binding protein [Ruminococcus sp.]
KTADSANADVYEKNEKMYQEKLKALDDKHTDALVKSDKKYDTLLFGDRFPFRYLVDDYKLKYCAAFAGCSADSEASFETVAFLADKLTELELPAVLTIDGSDGKLAETIIETSDNKTAQILQLNSMQAVSKEMIDSGDDYIGMMEKNLDVLKTALAVGK